MGNSELAVLGPLAFKMGAYAEKRRVAEEVQNVRGTETPPPAWLPNINDIGPDPDTNRQYDAVRELWLIAQGVGDAERDSQKMRDDQSNAL